MPKEISVPFQYSPRTYQLDFLQAPQRFKVLVIHRRGGKSMTVLNEQIRKTQERPGIYYYFLPTYAQAKKVIWDELVRKHVPMELVHKLNASELCIYWKNGSIQRFAGCEDIDKHRGINPIDVVLDEFSEMNPDIWTAIIQPVLRENHGTATFCFTPKGKNHSWELLQFAKQHPDNWYQSVLSVDDTHGLTQHEVDEARESMPEAMFRQEFMCDFLENAGAFFRRIKENVYNADDVPDPTHFYQMGIDLAKYNDFTVITPIDLFSFQVKKQERFNQVDWNFQKMLIQASALKYNNAKIKADRTGVGDPIVEDLERMGLNVGEDGAVVFSRQSRRELLDNLAILLQQDKIKIPNDPQLISELEAFQFVMTAKGKIDVQTRKGFHDDSVMSLALAVHGLTVPVKSTMTLPTSTSSDDYYSNSSFDRFAAI
jgi:hypothetical protein